MRWTDKDLEQVIGVGGVAWTIFGFALFVAGHPVLMVVAWVQVFLVLSIWVNFR